MKRLLLLSVFSIFCLTISAQTKTWVGPAGGNFNVAANWSPAGVPASSHDVIIPTGSDMIMNGADIKSITLQGNAVATITGNITFTNASSIATNATLNGNSGHFNGSGTLTNNGTLNDNGIVLANTVTIINNATYNINSMGAHYMGYGSPTLNNTTSGVINLKAASGSIQAASGQGTIINSGLIKRAQGTGVYNINIPLLNNSGTIKVETGKLEIQNALTEFNGGTYNVSTGSILEWSSTFTCTGTLTGQLDGTLNWLGILKVLPGENATLNFNGSTAVNWVSGTFNGDGTLTNAGILNLETANGKVIGGQSIFKNEGSFNVNSSAALYIGYGEPTFNNTGSGTININSDGSIQGASGYGTIVNTGLIKRSQNTGLFTINNPLQNNDGIITVEKGTLKLQNASNKLTDGTYNVTSDGILQWSSTLTCLGTLTGQIVGNLEWLGILKVLPGTEAILNFSGPAGVKWISGSFDGGGTLTNKGILNLETANGKVIGGQSILKNEGSININSSAAFYIGYGTPTLNNTATGIININSDGSIQGASGYGNIVNTGLIKRKQNTGLYRINNPLHNNNGTIIVETGTLELQNASTVLTDGTYTVEAAGTMEWSSTFTCTGTLTGQLNGTLNWNGTLNVAPQTEAILDFDTPKGITWVNGTFSGGGTLINKGILNLETANGKVIAGQSIFKNEGVFNINSSAALYVGYGTPTLNNTASGIININSAGSIQGASGYGTIVNTGLIKRTLNTGLYTINNPLQNDDGTIAVEKGILQLQNASNQLTDGTYNVASDGVMQWTSTITCLGTLTGEINGTLEWLGTLNVIAGTDATLNFSGPAGVKWISGTFNGDGTLTNKGILNLESANGKVIGGQSIFKNEGAFNINSSAALYLGYGTPTFNNTTSGIININSDGSIQAASGNGNIVNTGVIKKEPSTGNFSIASNVQNTSPGEFIAETGLLKFNGSFAGNGTITGNGSIQLANNTTFEGTVSPGGLPGTLTYIGNYKSSANTILVSEIYGPISGTQYDVYDVQGSAVIDGNIEVNLSYAANLNDEFVILTANSITSCNLPATISATYDSHIYTFDVVCNTDNVTLKVTSILVGIVNNQLSNLSLYPNPSYGRFTLDLGKEYTEVTVQVINTLGRIVSSKKYASTRTIENEINDSVGIYFVRVSTATGESTTLRILNQ